MTDPTVAREIRVDVSDLLVRYAAGIDRRDWALFRTCFTADCEADYGAIGVWHGVDTITDWMEKAHVAFRYTLHRITNQHVTIDGDTVTARSYVDGVFVFEDERPGLRAIGFYDDELVRTGEGWKIAHRRFTPVFQGSLSEMPAG